MSKKERVSAFLEDNDTGTPVEFDDAPDAVVYSASVGDAKKALEIAGKDASLSEWAIAKMICTTEDAETGEPYFDKSHFKLLCEARGDAKDRLQRLLDAADGGELGNVKGQAQDE